MSKEHWTIWLVEYDPPCGPREEIGYYQSEESAKLAAQEFAAERYLEDGGICCVNKEHLRVHRILIKP